MWHKVGSQWINYCTHDWHDLADYAEKSSKVVPSSLLFEDFAFLDDENCSHMVKSKAKKGGKTQSLLLPVPYQKWK